MQQQRGEGEEDFPFLPMPWHRIIVLALLLLVVGLSLLAGTTVQ
jgi:hypothetical protein